MAKEHLHLYSPLPPARCGAADYTLELLPYLARDWDLTVVIDDEAPSPLGVPDGVRVMRRTAASEANLGILRLYQLGNNAHHKFVFEEACARPGVTVLHDYVLHHLVVDMTLAQGNHAGYQQYMKHDYGDHGVRTAQQRLYSLFGKKGRFFSEMQPFLMPLNGPAISTSRGIIVHSQALLDRIAARRPDVPLARIPLQHSPLPHAPLSREAARDELGLGQDKLILCTFGFLTLPKQIDLVLRALRMASDHMPPFEYWLVGEDRDILPGLLRQARQIGLEDRVFHTGFVDARRFQRYLEACDLVVNLRYPSACESSATLVRALGLGRCALVFDYDAFSDFPPETVRRVPLDTMDARPLCEIILEASHHRILRERTEEAARRYIASEHSAERCASLYTAFLRRVSEQKTPSVVLRQLLDTFEEGSELDQYARLHARRWAATMELVPRPGAGAKALELGSYAVVMPMLRHYFGYEQVMGADFEPGRSGEKERRTHAYLDGSDAYDIHLFDAESDRYPFPNEYFDLVLVCEVIEHLSVDPMFLMSEVNRVLKIGGRLLLTTPNIISLRSMEGMLKGYHPYLFDNFNRNQSTNRHNIEYAPSQIAVLLQAGGFEVERMHSVNCWSDAQPDMQRLLEKYGYSTYLRGDNMLALGRKKTCMIDRWPAEIYGPGPSPRYSSLDGPLMPPNVARQLTSS